MALTNRLSPVARTVALVGALLLIALVATLTLRGIRASQEREAALGWERHTFVVLVEAERLEAKLRGAESAQRGYLLSADEPFYVDFQHHVKASEASLERLRALTTDNPAQLQSLRALGDLVGARLALLRKRAGVAHSLGVIENTGYAPGRAAMHGVIAQLNLIRAEEQRLLAMRRAAANAVDRRGDRINFLLATLGVGLAALAAVVGLAAFDATNRSRAAASRAAEEVRMREGLEARVAERTEDLRAANARLRAEADTREAAEAQVRQMQKMESIGQLTGGIAHDFNNMLAIVIGSLDMARRRFDADPDKAKTYIDNAEEGARRAAQLTARLLAFSRQQPLTPEPLDVNKLVGDTSELIRRTIGEQVRLETVLAGGLWRANVDRGQLENAILNLAVNARDAMEDGQGKITLETANTHLDEDYARTHAEVKPGQYVVICVTDTGTGMPPDVIERAFDPFFTTKQVGKGTGLGLSQVFGFVKQSAGHVKIYSEPGVGTTVKVYLPRWFGADTQSGRAAVSVGEMPRARGDEIILVVEDEQRVRHLTVDTLRELGYTVVQASDGAIALEQVTMQPRIDLLFTDIVMPEMNGRELADRARVLRPGLRVLFTTGYTRNAVVHNGMVDPGVSLLSKPFSIRDLAVRVRGLLDEAPRP